jgi:vacuolar protein sorting-associated protein IST1
LPIRQPFPFDELEDCKDSTHGYTHPHKRQLMSNSSRSSEKEDTGAFDEIKPYGGKTSSTGSFSGKNHVEDRDNYPTDLDTRKTHRRNICAARKVHSEIKFDDSKGLCSESG